MNLTPSIHERVLKKARKAAQSVCLSLNEAARRVRKGITGGHSAEDDIREIQALSAQSRDRSRGWRFTREEIHDWP